MAFMSGLIKLAVFGGRLLIRCRGFFGGWGVCGLGVLTIGRVCCEGLGILKSEVVVVN